MVNKLLEQLFSTYADALCTIKSWYMQKMMSPTLRSVKAKCIFLLMTIVKSETKLPPSKLYFFIRLTQTYLENLVFTSFK